MGRPSPARTEDVERTHVTGVVMTVTVVDFKGNTLYTASVTRPVS